MGPPPIHLFLTTIASQQALRQRQEYLLRIFEVKKIPFIPYDLASDEAAKRIWKRKAPADKQQLPGILVGGEFIGTFQDFEEAVEFDELEKFLRRNEEYNPGGDRPLPPAQVVGVPGAATPEQMTPDRLKPHIYAPKPSPLKGKSKQVPVNKRTDEFDAGDVLEGYGLQGVKVTHDDLEALVKELGLEGDETDDLVKGLSDMTVLGDSEKAPAKPKQQPVVSEEPKQPKVEVEEAKPSDSPKKEEKVETKEPEGRKEDEKKDEKVTSST